MPFPDQPSRPCPCSYSLTTSAVSKKVFLHAAQGRGLLRSLSRPRTGALSPWRFPAEGISPGSPFSLQNVLLQMGLHVLAVNGMLIRQARNYVLRCHGCFKYVSRALNWHQRPGAPGREEPGGCSAPCLHSRAHCAVPSRGGRAVKVFQASHL